MILSYLIIALSLFFAPLALGRPASTPTYKVSHPGAPAEPNELLGRHYLIHERREAAYLRSVPATKASPHAQQTTRHMKPFARYFADRSGDTWMHESRLRELRLPRRTLCLRAPAPSPLYRYGNGGISVLADVRAGLRAAVDVDVDLQCGLGPRGYGVRVEPRRREYEHDFDFDAVGPVAGDGNDGAGQGQEGQGEGAGEGAQEREEGVQGEEEVLERKQDSESGSALLDGVAKV